MIIKKTQDIEAIVGAHLAQQEPQVRDIAVRINTNFKVSKKVHQSDVASVAAPIERETVMQAASLIQQLLLECTATSHHTQANTRREKVQLLLEETE